MPRKDSWIHFQPQCLPSFSTEFRTRNLTRPSTLGGSCSCSVFLFAAFVGFLRRFWARRRRQPIRANRRHRWRPTFSELAPPQRRRFPFTARPAPVGRSDENIASKECGRLLPHFFFQFYLSLYFRGKIARNQPRKPEKNPGGQITMGRFFCRH